jgi:hypothetical protein
MKKKEKIEKLKKKRKEEESLWITVVIHSEMCGEGGTVIPPL